MPRKTKAETKPEAKLEVPPADAIDGVEEAIRPELAENNIAFNTANAAKNDNISPDQIFDQEGELVVDVFETNSDFMVTAAIAGIQIKDLDISLEKDMMVIKGNRCDPHMHADKRYFYQECYWGPFSRKIILPENIDIDKADAQIDKGILTVKIPKNEITNGKIGVKLS